MKKRIILAVIAVGCVVGARSADMTIAKLHELTENQEQVNLTITDGKVVFIDTRGDKPNVFVRDGGKAVMFYGTDIPFKLNATVKGTVNVDYEMRNGSMPGVKANALTDASALTITESSVEAQPMTATLEDVLAGKYKCDLVKICNVNVSSESNGGTDGEAAADFYASDGSGMVRLYGTENAPGGVSGDNKYDVTAVYSNQYVKYLEFLPVSVENVTTGIGSVTAGGEADEDAPVYNLSGQRIGKDAKGIVIQGGKKSIRR